MVQDYGNLDVLLRANEAAACGDAQLHAAWEAAAQFKKRYLEHQAELRSIRETAARMQVRGCSGPTVHAQHAPLAEHEPPCASLPPWRGALWRVSVGAGAQAQLDETHRLLHQEHKKRYGLEDELTRLRMELQRLRDLEARVELERKERVKLEREYLNLQSKALNAPGNALGEVRRAPASPPPDANSSARGHRTDAACRAARLLRPQLRTLREEIFALRRDKALAEAKEAEVRRELSHLREQVSTCFSLRNRSRPPLLSTHLMPRLSSPPVPTCDTCVLARSLQLDGMSLEQYRAWQREYHELKKRVATLTLELQVRTHAPSPWVLLAMRCSSGRKSVRPGACARPHVALWAPRCVRPHNLSPHTKRAPSLSPAPLAGRQRQAGRVPAHRRARCGRHRVRQRERCGALAWA